MTEQQKYGYTPEFQIQIAALILRDIAFMREYEDVIDPNYFDVEELGSIVRIARDYYDKNQELPTRASLIQEVQDHVIRYKVPKEEISNLLMFIEAIYVDKLHALNGEAVRERICRFGRRQAVRQGVLKIVDLVETDTGLDKASDIMNDALRVGFNANTMGFNFFKESLRLPDIIAAKASPTNCVRTMIKKIDENLQGGPGRGEVWVVLGLSGQGKSQWLVNMGIAAIRQRIPVAHVTIGDLDEDAVALRYACNFTKCTQWSILQDATEFKRKVKSLPNYEGYLRIKYYDPGTTTVAHLRAWLSKIHTVDGVLPGLLIVDYPDEMKLEGDPYEAMGKIYSELKVIAKQYNLLVWVASQVHRWKPSNEPNGDVLKQNNIADSAKKVFKADGILSINQSIQENDGGFGRIWVDKVRRGKRQFKVFVEVDFGMSLIKESEFNSFDEFQAAVAQIHAEDAERHRLETT